MNLSYRDNSYFNSEDCYIFRSGFGKLYVSRLEFSSGGCWYFLEGLRYKATTVECVNCNEVYHSTVSFSSARGKAIKFMNPNNIGVMWDQGSKALPCFWNDVNKLQIL